MHTGTLIEEPIEASREFESPADYLLKSGSRKLVVETVNSMHCRPN